MIKSTTTAGDAAPANPVSKEAEQDAKPEQILELFQRVGKIADAKIARINDVTGQVKILALNAQIEATRAGESGKTFSVVANHVKAISKDINKISSELSDELAGSIVELNELGKRVIQKIRGQRLADLSLNMIEIIDRNLYERSCDVRWWATDSAVVDAVAPSASNRAAAKHASHRLSVILSSYTVYLDIWIVNAKGKVVANGRPADYPGVVGTNVSDLAWFKSAMATLSGSDYAVADIETCAELQNRLVAVYSTAIRKGGDAGAKVIGALGIFFDWGPQAAAVVKGVRITEDEQDATRCLLIDSKHRIIAASDDQGILDEHLHLKKKKGQGGGFYLSADGKSVIGFALTPGYETYRGLGWYGAIVQKLPEKVE